jgi:hypothetical protein
MTVVNPAFATMKRMTKSRVVRTICFDKIIIVARLNASTIMPCREFPFSAEIEDF